MFAGIFYLKYQRLFFRKQHSSVALRARVAQPRISCQRAWKRKALRKGEIIVLIYRVVLAIHKRSRKFSQVESRAFQLQTLFRLNGCRLNFGVVAQACGNGFVDSHLLRRSRSRKEKKENKIFFYLIEF